MEQYYDVKVKSPAGAPPELFSLKVVSDNVVDEASSSLKITLDFILDDVEYLKFDKELLNNFSNVNWKSISSIISFCDLYNACVDRFIQESQEYNIKPAFKSRLAKPEVLRFIIDNCYSRSVDVPTKLNSYRPFSNKVYGETTFKMVQQITDQVKIESDDRFIDLGSGVGQVVLQVAASTRVKDCFGIESNEYPAECAQRMAAEFRRLMDFFGKPYQPFTLIHDDFMASQYASLIESCTVVFANNFAFGPELNYLLSQRFAQLADGSRIVASKSFVCRNARLSQRRMNDLCSIVRTHDLAEVKDAVSWTSNPFKYCVHTIDHSQLYRWFEQQNEASKKRSIKKSKSSTSNSTASETASVEGSLNGSAPPSVSGSEKASYSSSSRGSKQSTTRSSSSSRRRRGPRLSTKRRRNGTAVNTIAAPAADHRLPQMHDVAEDSSATASSTTTTTSSSHNEPCHSQASSLDSESPPTLPSSISSQATSPETKKSSPSSPLPSSKVSENMSFLASSSSSNLSTSSSSPGIPAMGYSHSTSSSAIASHLQLTERLIRHQIHQLQQPQFEAQMERELGVEKTRHQMLSDRLSGLEGSVHSLQAEGVRLLNAFASQLGMILTSTSNAEAFFTEAAKILHCHQALEERVAHLNAEIVQLSNVQSQLQQRQSELEQRFSAHQQQLQEQQRQQQQQQTSVAEPPSPKRPRFATESVLCSSPEAPPQLSPAATTATSAEAEPETAEATPMTLCMVEEETTDDARVVDDTVSASPLPRLEPIVLDAEDDVSMASGTPISPVPPSLAIEEGLEDADDERDEDEDSLPAIPMRKRYYSLDSYLRTQRDSVAPLVDRRWTPSAASAAAQAKPNRYSSP